MLRRGPDHPDDTGIPPEGLDIPNVADREVLRPAGIKIANNIAEFFDNAVFPDVEESVNESGNLVWTGVGQKLFLPFDNTSYGNCDNWSTESDLTPSGGVYGKTDESDIQRIGYTFVRCATDRKLLCASY